MSPSNPVLVKIVAPDALTRVELLDAKLQSNAPPADGEMQALLTPGVYTARLRRGRMSTDKLFMVSPGETSKTIHLLPQDAPQFNTAAPLENTLTTHEYHRYPARDLSRQISHPLPDGSVPAALFVFVRDILPGRSGNAATGLVLADLKGNPLFDFGAEGMADDSSGWSGANLALQPGAYMLRCSARNGWVTQRCIHLRPGWQIQVFLFADDHPDRPRRATLARMSVEIARIGEGFDFSREDLMWTETALKLLARAEALADGDVPEASRATLTPSGAAGETLLNKMLQSKYENPMLGVYATLLYLRSPSPNLQRLGIFVDNLKALLGTPPDVQAIAFAKTLLDEAADPAMKATRGDPVELHTPPMLRDSWNWLQRAVTEGLATIAPESVLDRAIDNTVAGGPWMTVRLSPRQLGAPTPAAELARSAIFAATVPAAAEILLDGFARTKPGITLGESLSSSIRKRLSGARDSLSALADQARAAGLSDLLARVRNPGVHWQDLESLALTRLEERLVQLLYPMANRVWQSLLAEDDAQAFNIEQLQTRALDYLQHPDKLEAELGVPVEAIVRNLSSLRRKLERHVGLATEALPGAIEDGAARGQAAKGEA